MAENKRDYYEVLGVEKDISEDELKKAYRKKAKLYHPDLHPGDAEAEKNFKEVNEAYEVLSDKDKRARYDQFGHAGVDPNFGAGGGGNPFGGGFGGFDFGDIGDIFGSFFGGGFGGQGRGGNPNAPRRGSNIEATVAISFEEAAKGCIKKIDIQRIETCDECSGSGAEKGTQPVTCANCQGRGSVVTQQRTPFGVMQTQQPCSQCQGRGKKIEKPCTKCNGKGRIRRTVNETVNIPEGIDDEQAFRIVGKGNAGTNGGGSGDLIVEVFVRPHPVFTRHGFDVLCEVPVTFTQAALGDEITVPTLDGKVKFTIKEGTQPGDEFRLKGKGIKRMNSYGRGDQYVRIIVEVPRELNREQKKLLKKFEEITDDKNYGKKKSFFDTIKDLFD